MMMKYVEHRIYFFRCDSEDQITRYVFNGNFPFIQNHKSQIEIIH